MLSDCFPGRAEKTEVEKDFRWFSQNLAPGKGKRREISLLALSHIGGSTLKQKLQTCFVWPSECLIFLNFDLVANIEN